MKGIFLSLLVLISAELSATTYYVSTTGSNSNDGLSISTPWETLRYAEAHATSPGDIIALKKGDIWASTRVVVIKHGGSSGNPITWDGSLWGTGPVAIIQSSGNRVTGNDAVVNIIACSYVTFKDIAVDGNNTQTSGLVIGGQSGYSNNIQNNENHIIIEGCSIINCGNGGDYRIGLLCQTWGTDISDITVQNCILDGSDDEQLSFYPGKSQDGAVPKECKNLIIRNNTLTNWGRRGQLTGYGMQINNKCTNVLIENNTLIQGANGKGDALHIESNEGIPGYFPSGVVIRYNRITIGTPNDWCVLIQHGQAKTVDFYSNQMISTSASSNYGGNIWITISSPDYAGAQLNFYSNTLYTRSGITYLDDSTTPGVCNFKNNIIFNEGGINDYCLGTNITGSTIHTNNLYYKTVSSDAFVLNDGGDIRRSSALINWEPSAKHTDPLFNDLSNFDFTLRSGSPAIGAGIPISEVLTDLAGRTYSNPPSMGCYEAFKSTGDTILRVVPGFVNSEILNGSPGSIEMYFNSSLAYIVPDYSVFTVLVNSVVRTVSSVIISGPVITLTLISPVLKGDIVTITYTKPATNPIQTVSGGEAETINDQLVSNNVASSESNIPNGIKITIYPNPLHQIINLIFQYNNSSSAADPSKSTQILRIFNISGMLVFEKYLDAGISNIQIPINLIQGIYSVMIMSGGLQTASQKIVVN